MNSILINGNESGETNLEENTPEESTDTKGLFIPRWLIVLIVGPIFGGGITAVGYVTNKVSAQSAAIQAAIEGNKERAIAQDKAAAIAAERLTQIGDKIQTGNTLILQLVSALDKRVDRLEDFYIYNRKGVERERDRDK